MLLLLFLLQADPYREAWRLAECGEEPLVVVISEDW